MSSELLYQICLTLIDGIGDINSKNLLAYCGSAEEVFKQKFSHLKKIPGIGDVLARSIYESKTNLIRAEEEIRFIEKYKITPIFFTSDNYPTRLKYCNDAPILLYFKGNADLNADRIVSIVGSRKPTEYGQQKTEELVKELSDSGVIILSGLAYGIDALAHKTALNSGLKTIGVLGHGLDRVYPQNHERLAKKMLTHGGLLTDFLSGTNPDATNFPKRNRIVAGLCDALVVIESKRTGGSLITATIANSYNKDVFAFPGRAGDVLSEGCNGLIKRNKAAMIESAADLVDAMQWKPIHRDKKKSQFSLQINLSQEETLILSLFNNQQQKHIDEICQLSQLPISKVSSVLLQLEFNNLIKSKPGKIYEAIQ